MNKKTLFITTLLLTVASLAYATNQTASCPQDGESAFFTGNKKIDNDRPMDRSRDVCEYSHDHMSQDGNGFHNQRHVFWQNCGD